MQKDSTGYKNLRRNRISVPGSIYHITSVTRDRIPIFGNFANARKLIKILAAEQEHESVDILCFCVMPDHFHWLFQLQKGELSRLVKRVKSKTTRAIESQIWQQGYYDHHLRSDESLITVSRYIVANPIRSELVAHIGDYPHWYTKWL